MVNPFPAAAQIDEIFRFRKIRYIEYFDHVIFP